MLPTLTQEPRARTISIEVDGEHCRLRVSHGCVFEENVARRVDLDEFGPFFGAAWLRLDQIWISIQT
jgi:hypothetical protein